MIHLNIVVGNRCIKRLIIVNLSPVEKTLSPKGAQLTKSYYSVVSLKHHAQPTVYLIEYSTKTRYYMFKLINH